MPKRTFLSRCSLANSGTVIQHHKLLYTRMAIDKPTILYIQKGYKILRWRGQELTIYAGEMVLLSAGQTFDVLNNPDTENGYYQACWIALEQAIVDEFADLFGIANLVQELHKIQPDIAFQSQFEQAILALGNENLPELVLKLKLFELLAWLKAEDLSFSPYEKQNLLRQVRKMIAANPAFHWTSEYIAEQLHLSETSLRRALRKAETTFRDVLTDVRMSRALTLLQITPWQIVRIANEVGYDSPSRFTVRFKQRFGFLPSDVRSTFSQPIQDEQQKLIRVGIKNAQAKT